MSNHHSSRIKSQCRSMFAPGSVAVSHVPATARRLAATAFSARISYRAPASLARLATALSASKSDRATALRRSFAITGQHSLQPQSRSARRGLRPAVRVPSAAGDCSACTSTRLGPGNAGVTPAAGLVCCIAVAASTRFAKLRGRALLIEVAGAERESRRAV